MATAFPSGRASLAVKLADVADAVNAGADEVDMVIDRGAFLAGRYAQVYEEVRAVREACGTAHLKVILETGELATLDNTARAAWLAMLAGADFIKTSTGKVTPAATPPVALVMLSAVRDFAEATGRRVGVKVAGGIRTAKDAIRYLVLVREIAGQEWLTPALPHRRLQPAQRPAHAAEQAAHRRLRRAGLLHPGLNGGLRQMVGNPPTAAKAGEASTGEGSAWDYAPAPESRDIVTIRPEYGLFVDGEFVPPAGRGVTSPRSTPPRRKSSPGRGQAGAGGR